MDSLGCQAGRRNMAKKKAAPKKVAKKTVAKKAPKKSAAKKAPAVVEEVCELSYGGVMHDG